jgi:hypothetical protein
VIDRVIEYAPADAEPVHSRYGVAGFTCAVCAAAGILLTMLLFVLPIPGPVGGMIRERVAPAFGALVLLTWLAGIALGIVGLRNRKRVRTFATAALALSGGIVVLFGLMLLMY